MTQVQTHQPKCSEARLSLGKGSSPLVHFLPFLPLRVQVGFDGLRRGFYRSHSNSPPEIGLFWAFPRLQDHDAMHVHQT